MVQNAEESRTQLSGNLQMQADELAQLNRIAIALTSEFDLQKLLQMITDAARRVTAAQYAAFFLILLEVTTRATEDYTGLCWSAVRSTELSSLWSDVFFRRSAGICAFTAI
ncbi:MAG TPA: hypothetical protein VF026_22570 [Ktedonobacteraceae bacterium]